MMLSSSQKWQLRQDSNSKPRSIKVTVIGNNNQCKHVPGADVHEFHRLQFTDLHNKFRESATKGYAHLGPFGYTAYAEDMEFMSWDCNAEVEAIKLAKKCVGKENKLTAPSGYKLNGVMVDKANHTNPKTAIDEGLGKWRNEITRAGLTSMLFEGDLKTYASHATKMLWHNNNKLACAVEDCASKNKYSIVCLYAPGGNVDGESVYKEAEEYFFSCLSCPTGLLCDEVTDRLCKPDWALP
ncbi:hypothetical protein Q1695_007583 [Nippostrongylus brasiliensis]|nr:hypothetical protein Q1695_007583 [Nippostrongylus brasiliensis]